MVDAFTTAPFSIGTSSSANTGFEASQSMDMSLDELIKARRDAEMKKNDNTTHTPRNKPRRKSLKSTPTSSSSSNKNSKAQNSIGAGKAKRNARNAAKRGIQSNDKPNPMDIEREVYRQQRTSGGRANTRNNMGRPARRSDRIKDNNSRSETDRKTKAKNLSGRNNNNNNRNQRNHNQKGDGKDSLDGIKPPSRKVVNAAMKAMNTAGYEAPKGMKMVISFAPVPDKKKPNKKQTGNNNNNTNTRNNQRGRRN